MRILLVIHRGDQRPGAPVPSPHWLVCVQEDGKLWGDITEKGQDRSLPEDFQLADPCRFFDIPSELQQHRLKTEPHPEDIVLALKEFKGRTVCSFLESQLTEPCPLRAVLDELLQKMQEFLASDAQQPACEKDNG
jgi:hypothetical protein